MTTCKKNLYCHKQKYTHKYENTYADTHTADFWTLSLAKAESPVWPVVSRWDPCRILRSGQSTLMHEAKQWPTDIETMCDKVSQTTSMTSPRFTNLYSPPPPPRLPLLPPATHCCWVCFLP